MGYFDLAGQAIEDMVRREHPDDSDNWAAIVPMDDEQGWGLNLAAWAVQAEMVIENFDGLVGDGIDVPDVAVQNAGAKALDEFQAYLAAKADHRDAHKAFLRSIVPLVGWEL
jgi:hypothetical protein